MTKKIFIEPETLNSMEIDCLSPTLEYSFEVIEEDIETGELTNIIGGLNSYMEAVKEGFNIKNSSNRVVVALNTCVFNGEHFTSEYKELVEINNDKYEHTLTVLDRVGRVLVKQEELDLDFGERKLGKFKQTQVVLVGETEELTEKATQILENNSTIVHSTFTSTELEPHQVELANILPNGLLVTIGNVSNSKVIVNKKLNYVNTHHRKYKTVEELKQYLNPIALRK